MSLTPKQALFVAEYLKDLNATQAAIRAGYSEKTAYSIGNENLRKPEIAEAIQKGAGDRIKAAESTAEDVIRDFHLIASGDVNELVEYRRGACRYCYGRNNDYQRTTREMERDRDAWRRSQASRKEGAKAESFNEQGGTGYDPRKDPNPDCQECFGEGEARTFCKDTRKLTGAARRLYAGVKVTKDGLEVKMRDQDAALVNLGRYHKLFTDKVEHSADDKLADLLVAGMQR